MELSAFAMTFWKIGRHFRTYPAYVEDEVRAALGPEGRYVRGPFELGHRGGEKDRRGSWLCEDGNYLSARWPGDAFAFADRLVEMIREARAVPSAGESLQRAG